MQWRFGYVSRVVLFPLRAGLPRATGVYAEREGERATKTKIERDFQLRSGYSDAWLEGMLNQKVVHMASHHSVRVNNLYYYFNVYFGGSCFE